MPKQKSNFRTADQALVKLRPLGPLERYFAAWHHLRFYLNVGVTAYYTSPSNPRHDATSSLESTIFAALNILIWNHPILCCVILGEDTRKPHFARLARIDLRQVVTFVVRQRPFARQYELKNGGERDVELDELLEQQHNTPFEDTLKPYWRLVILSDPSAAAESSQTFVVAFISHRSLTDGISGMIFHRELLKTLNRTLIPLATTTIRTPNSGILPSMETLIRFKHSLAYLVKTSWAKKFSRRPRGFWTGEPVSKPSVGHFRSRSFAPEVTERFVRLCRKEGTTVQAALQVLVADCLFRSIPKEFVCLRCIIPIDLRRWCESEVGASMGTLNSIKDPIYVRKEPGQEFDWEDALKSRENIQEYLATKGRNDKVGTLKYVRNPVKFSLAHMRRQRDGSFELSNVGRFQGNKKDDRVREGEQWKIGRMVFGQSASVMSSAILVTVITGGDGGMTLGFAWQEKIVEEEVIERLIFRIGSSIRELIAKASS